MMNNAMMKMFGDLAGNFVKNLPPEITQTVLQIWERVKTFDERLARVENTVLENNALLKQILERLEHGQRSEHGGR